MAAELDRVVVTFCEAGNHHAGWTIDYWTFFEVIRFVWLKRLPLSPEELWNVLEAHGALANCRGEIISCFGFGRDLLVHCVGRKPVRKNRVPPASVALPRRQDGPTRPDLQADGAVIDPQRSTRQLRAELNLAEAIRRRLLPLGGADELEPHPPVPVPEPLPLDDPEGK